MPELPEVETIRRQLDEVLKGKEISAVEVLREKSFSGKSGKLVGWKIKGVERKSKVLEFIFEGKDEMVISHLKMTGQYIYLDKDRRIAGGHPTKDWIRDLPSSHTRVVWTFTDGSKLYFNDMRVFGWMRIVNSEKYINETRKQVPDVIEDSFDLQYFKSVIGKSKKAIKLVILDQDKMGGIGNIYANDALFLAKILPDRPVDSLSDKEIKVLIKSIKEVINKGIKYGGASASDDKYVNVSGLGGKYQEHFLVYQRAGQKCNVCGSLIKKTKIGGRGTFYCSVCQV
jgi:formamidopyrimidine-DNA glycosylase